MKINFSTLNQELLAKTNEVSCQIGLEPSLQGLPITAEKGEKLTVVCDGKSVHITYPALNQYFRALSILAQNGNKKFSVTEECATTELGIMLDCSRNAVKTVAHLKEIIRHLALMGYNQLQLYTEDTYEVENEPYFGYGRGRYTIAEMKEIDDYAFSFGIEVVPCIQTLAHLNCIFNWPAYNCVKDIDDILLIDEERTYILINNMFYTLSKTFRTRKIHIGMDEAHMVGRGAYADIFGHVENKSELILKHLNKVIEIADKYGFKPMMWSDMFFRLAFNGSYYPSENQSAEISQEVMSKVPQNLRLVYWDYYHTDYQSYANMIDCHLAFNREIMFAGGAWTWNGFAPINDFSLVATKQAIDACFDKKVDKIMLTMWGDNGAECSALGVLPTLCYTAERIYGHTTYDKAFKVLTGVDLNKFLALDLPNKVIPSETAHISNPCKFALYSDTIGGWLDYALKKDGAKAYSEFAKTLRDAEKVSGKYSYLFKTLRLLCEVLELKYNLGSKTREAYKCGDKLTVKKMLKTNYIPLVKRLEAFYDAFKEQWMKENKPNGFEVQDYRIGGLIMRTKHNIETLKAWTDDKLDKIVQFEESLLEPNNGSFNSFNSFAKNATVCPF